MKALVADAYGGPEVLKIVELDRPVPQAEEVLVKVHYTTVNRTDTGILCGEPLFARLVFGIRRPKVRIRGTEFSGEVVEVGAQVTTFAVGDRVFGFQDERGRAQAEYVAAPVDIISKIPDGISYEEAAPASEGPFYAQNALWSARLPDGGFRFLINGVSGSIGTAAAQLATAEGAEVVGVCGTHAMDRVRDLGLSKVIDYQKEDFDDALSGEQFDFFLDTVGNISYRRGRHYLSPKGVFGCTELGPGWQNVTAAMKPKALGGNAVFGIPRFHTRCRHKMVKLWSEGKYRAVIDRTYPFEEIIEAYRYVFKGKKTGNVLIKMNI